MEFLSWELAGQILSAIGLIGGVFYGAKAKKAVKEWKELIQAVQRAGADGVWTTEEVQSVLKEGAEALSSLVPFGKRLLGLK